MKKILIVTDDPGIVEGKGIFARADFRTFRVGTVREALQIHREERVDLIIADLELPDLGGDNFCFMVRREEGLRAVSFIVLCHDKADHIDRVSRCGANARILKPVRPGDLLAKVEELLAISRRQEFRVLLKVQVKGITGTETFFCHSRNLSTSGMLIEVDRDLAHDEVITCMFFIPGAPQIVAEGEVVRSAPAAEGRSYGIRFRDLPQDSRQQLEHFMAAAS